ncbi:hypothetical protein PFISCL1PPCAC_29188 [Pristionchus fissidentatus]|uniref:Alpha-1,6-mannosyl-glycoprotein 2-beta-N-acetylglucosaminyltransferase n=1 Tax=Pristionchus fissidentatus TaxID=1538716 RepID=A0AAV5WZK4_9BILA|nr:hypothetical protein PFISCL1PPCAC_29188 [Pristionchus fissidentatus]
MFSAGQDPRDCPEKISKDDAKAKGCQNWEHPDKYGNYRIAKFTQIKHHWWWKMNYVFDGIIDRYGLESAWILLLEEDHYMSPDALHVLNHIIDNRNTLCADCELISLGFYLKSFASYGQNIDRLGVHPWFSSKHNMGMALQKNTWTKIKNCSELFCTWDDYNWDWSLLQISVKCLPQRFKVIFTKAPRVLHVGDCGVHTHRCAVSNAAKAAEDLLTQHSSALFPQSMKVTEVSRRMLKPSKENGGWGDERDRSLCMRNTHPQNRSQPGEIGHKVLDDLFSSSVDFRSKIKPTNATRWS